VLVAPLERNANDLQNKLLAFFILPQILNLATFWQHFDISPPFLRYLRGRFGGDL
jgi:hypothetical protein